MLSAEGQLLFSVFIVRDRTRINDPSLICLFLLDRVVPIIPAPRERDRRESVTRTHSLQHFPRNSDIALITPSMAVEDQWQEYGNNHIITHFLKRIPSTTDENGNGC